MKVVRWNSSVLFLALVISLVFVAVPQASGEESEKDTPDCGLSSLYMLLKIEGRNCDLASVRAQLPEPRPAGYSMKELRDAARKCGLELAGVQLRKPGISPDRPMIVHMDRGEHGHFLIIRPVGHTRKLVQVIDPLSESYVVDATRLSTSTEWTGVGLIPVRTNWGALITGFIAGILSLLILLQLLIRRRRLGIAPQVRKAHTCIEVS